MNINKQSRRVEEHQSPSVIHKMLFPSQSDSQIRNQPCKSPSPDKRRANIITPTKSPEMIEIKRNMTPLRLSQRRFQKTPMEISSKNIINEQSTRYYTNEDFQEYRSSQHKKNQVLQELQEMLPQQFVLNNTNGSNMRMSQYRSAQQSRKELDYIRLLQQKERTIKELHEIIEMINRNNSLDLSASQLSGTKNKRALEQSDKFLSSLQSPSERQQKHHLKQQIKTLTIENQQLIHMIEKINQQQYEFKSSTPKSPLSQSKYSSVDPSRHQKQQYNQRVREENFIKELNGLKQSLAIKQTQCLQLNYENKQLLNKYTQVDVQNQKLIKMMKDKQLSDRKYHASLIQSTLSAQKSPESQIITNHNTFPNTKQKLSLIKIKEQYNESLKVFKDTVCGDVEEFMAQMGRSFNRLQHKIIQLEEQIQILERFKSAHENMKSKQKRSQLIPLSIEHNEQKELRGSPSKINELEELSQIQLRSPQKVNTHREIESLLLKRDNGLKVEKQQQEKRQVKQRCLRLEQQCSLLQSTIHDLQQKCKMLQSKCLKLQQMRKSQQIKIARKHEESEIKYGEEQMEEIRVRLQMKESGSKRRNQQIEDINLARAHELQIKSLRDMIKKYQLERQNEKRSMEVQIQKLSSQNMQYEIEINQMREKAMQQKMQSSGSSLLEIRHKLQISNNQLLQTKNELQSLKHEMQSIKHELDQARSGLEQSRVELKQRQKEINELRQLVLNKQQNQSHTHQQIQKLISNYEQEIGILKQTLSNEQLNHQQQIKKYEQQKSIYQQQIVRHQQQGLRNEQDRIRYQQERNKYQQDKARYEQQRLRYEEQIEQLNIQIRRMVSQGENVERLMSDSESKNKLQLQKANQSIKSLKQQLESMRQSIKQNKQQLRLNQQQLDFTKQQLTSKQQELTSKQQELQSYQHLLNTKTQQQHKWRQQEQQLKSEQQGMKLTIDRLLIVAKQVQQMEIERNKLTQNITRLSSFLAQEKQNNNLLIKQNNSLSQQNSALNEQNNLLTGQRDDLRSNIKNRQQEIQINQERIQILGLRVSELEQELSKKQEDIKNLREELEREVVRLRKELMQQQSFTDRLRKELMEEQSQSTRVRKQSEEYVSESEQKRSLQQSQHKAALIQYESKQSTLNRNIQQLTDQLQSLSQQCIQTKRQLVYLEQDYNELLQQQQHPLNELYQLRTLLNTQLSSIDSSQHDYDLAKLVIDYQSKCDQLLSLNTQLEQTKQQLVLVQSQKHLLQEKCISLQKNLTLYQTELKQRKLLTETLINSKTKLQKEFILIKNTQLQTHQQQSQSLKLNLGNLINKIVTIEQQRNRQLKQSRLKFQQRTPLYLPQSPQYQKRQEQI